MTPRELAYRVLHETESSGAFADALLGRSLETSNLSLSDRGLATVLVYGTLARVLTLDHTLAALSNRSLDKIDLPTLVLLRMGLFQIAFLDRVPDYAAVDTSVQLARRHTRDAAGFVNALLRRAAREGLRPINESDETTRISIENSHPRWLVKLWREELGLEEALALMVADNEPAPTVLRALGDRDTALAALERRGVSARAGSRAPQAIVVDAGGPAVVVATGLAVPQGEASQLAVLFARVRPGDRILDACAAPGGKTAYMATLAGPDGSVTAVDPSRGARRRIESTLERAGVTGVDIVESPLADLGPCDPFDLVLVDAPCSGLGTLRQHPEIRWRRRPADIADLSARQSAILTEAAARVRPGGCLIYATCTLTHAENEAVVDTLLAADGSFMEDSETDHGAALHDVVGADGRLRTFPHRHGTDGFFAARLRRRGG
jgi:16S rRNA (cytosine967-C5)-methyltransferase